MPSLRSAILASLALAAAAQRQCFDIFETMCWQASVDSAAGTVTFSE